MHAKARSEESILAPAAEGVSIGMQRTILKSIREGVSNREFAPVQ
jgi:hypothetical protein